MKRVVVACSGGPDSLALLALASLKYDVDAVYIDHGLRANTDHDAAIVREAAARFGARFHIVHLALDATANIEAVARGARYAALAKIRAELDADAILVAHTRDDQAETVLLNLLRGSGTAGLAGMATVNGFVHRPLLSMRRAETHEICARLGLTPARDPMNDDLQHRRVWLRREVIPMLERGADRDLVEVLARQAEVLRDDDALLNAVAAEHDIDDVAALAPAVARRVVRAWLDSPPPSLATVERVLDVARGVRQATELPGGERIERVRGRLARVRVGSAASDPAAVPLALPGRARFGNIAIEAWVEHGSPTAWPDGRALAVCDADAVAAEALVRPPRAGERFHPLGRSGSKLVHEALAEAGVAAGDRRTSPIVAAGEPIWVVGYRIDHRVRVTTRTRRFLWLSAESAGS